MAATISDNGFDYSQRDFFVTLYEAKTGDEIAPWPVSGTAGLALSPRGKLVAVAGQESGEKGKLLPVVDIHELPSGRKVGSVAHAGVKNGRS